MEEENKTIQLLEEIKHLLGHQKKVLIVDCLDQTPFFYFSSTPIPDGADLPEGDPSERLQPGGQVSGSVRRIQRTGVPAR